MVKASVIILSPHVLLPEVDVQKMRGILNCETKKTANKTVVISVSWWQTSLRKRVLRVSSSLQSDAENSLKAPGFETSV